jgi:hypothetical protein
LGFLNGCNESSVSRFVRVAAAACLQKISKLLNRTWAFSVAFDSSAIQATSMYAFDSSLMPRYKLSYACIAVAWVTHRPANVRRLRAGDGRNHPWLGRLPAVCSRLGECYIDALEAEHRSLRDHYLRDPLLKDMLYSMKDTIGYLDPWVSLQSQFPKLCEFSSSLATIYPGTTRVESDFSILGWERDEYRSALMDLSLEGIMHANQC